MKGTLHQKSELVDSAEKSYLGDRSILQTLFGPLPTDLILLLSEMKAKIHIATGGKKPWRTDVIKHLGLEEIIKEEKIHFLENKNRKDWQVLIKELNHPPSEIYVIGDLLQYDIEPPKKLGCRTIWINSEVSNKSDKADFQVSSLGEAIYLCKSLTLKWNFKKTSEYKLDLENTIAKITDLFNDGMGQEGWKPYKIKRQLKSSHVLGFLEDEYGKDFSYFFATIPKKRFDGKHLLWIDACSVRQRFQRNGIFSKGVEEIKNIYKKYNFGYVGGRSQNPIVFRTIDKLSSDIYYPFDKLYPSEMINFLKDTIKNEVKRPSETKEQGLNLENGIVTNAYWGKKLGNYKVDLNNEDILRYEKKLSEWGFDRCNGDSVIILKQIS